MALSLTYTYSESRAINLKTITKQWLIKGSSSSERAQLDKDHVDSHEQAEKRCRMATPIYQENLKKPENQLIKRVARKRQ